MLIRRPHVAGTFYPSDQAHLRTYCETHLFPEEKTVKARAVILPHAGYVYSGDTACLVLSKVEIPKRIFLMGPNHWNAGAPFALFSEGAWETPLGRVEVDREFAQAVLDSSVEIKKDEEAHRAEHSLEVLLPIIQMCSSDFKICPLLIGAAEKTKAREVAFHVGPVLRDSFEPLLLVISNDMNHYEADELTRKKDRYALDAILNLDEESLLHAVHEYRITMCGLMPVYMLLVMKDFLGIRKASLVDYRTSADASGDKQRVVGYAGFIFE